MNNVDSTYSVKLTMVDEQDNSMDFVDAMTRLQAWIKWPTSKPALCLKQEQECWK